jgi:HlyD family secretion protein
MIKRIIIGVLLLGAIGGITYSGLKPKPPKPTEVSLAKVGKESITRSVSAAGKLASATTVKINSNLSGDLVELNVKVGDKVTHGQVLARIDPTRYKAQVKSDMAAVSAAQAEIEVEKVAVAHADAELARIQALAQKGLSSAAEVEQGKANLDGEKAKLASAEQRAGQAQGQLEQSKDLLSKTTLASPIDGEVIELDRQLGERVRGSDFSEDVVMVLATLSQMEVRVEVGEHEVVYLQTGNKADVELDALEGKRFPGQVIEIGQNAIIRNPGTEAEVTSFPIRVALDNRPPGALPGMSATVHVATETHPSALVVPIQAVTVRPEKMIAKPTGPSETQVKINPPPEQGTPSKNELAKVVFMVHDGKAQLRRVKVGLSSDTSVEILEGLNEGDEVIEGPYRTLAKEIKDGDAVVEAKGNNSSGGGGNNGGKG